MIEIRRLLWDDWNVAHIARHDVTPEEVEEVCQGDPLARQSYAGRLIILGRDSAGDILAVVLNPQPEEGVYYVITARAASQKERRYYRQQKGETR